MHASAQIGEVVEWVQNIFQVSADGDQGLAVLHNRNKMVNAFAATQWVASSKGAVLSRSVTSCAGMTAYLVLMAQTKVGFLSGGRGKEFRKLPLLEQELQREEAYARATVALTRAQQVCLIMGPLDMRGLVGAATVVGCLKFGACFSGRDLENHKQLILQVKDEDILEAPSDSEFLQSVRRSCSKKNGVYPPMALAEAYKTHEDPILRVRRLHLIIVDLKRRKRLCSSVGKRFRGLDVSRVSRLCLNTLPVAYKEGMKDYQLRYAFGYALDGEDLPCYLIWPPRTDEDGFWLVDAWQNDWVQLDKCKFLAPVNIEHFFEGFALRPTRPWRAAACSALGLTDGQIAEDGRILSPSMEQSLPKNYPRPELGSS